MRDVNLGIAGSLVSLGGAALIAVPTIGEATSYRMPLIYSGISCLVAGGFIYVVLLLRRQRRRVISADDHAPGEKMDGLINLSARNGGSISDINFVNSTFSRGSAPRPRKRDSTPD